MIACYAQCDLFLKIPSIVQNNWNTCAYLSFWLLNSVSLILANKKLIGSTFPYPITLTMMHMMTASMFCASAKRIRQTKSPPYSAKIVVVSSLFAASLTLRNGAYRFLSVAIIQIVSAFSPLAVYVSACTLRLESFEVRYVACIIVVSIGICVSSFGFVAISLTGIAMQATGICLEAFRTALLQLLLQRPDDVRYDNVSLMAHIAPTAAALLLPLSLYETRTVGIVCTFDSSWPFVVSNCMLALGMNLASLLVIQVSSSLTISIASILRDMILICLSFLFWATDVTTTSCIGWLIAVVGIGAYSWMKNGCADHPRMNKNGQRRLTAKLVEIGDLSANDV